MGVVGGPAIVSFRLVKIEGIAFFFFFHFYCDSRNYSFLGFI